MIKDKPTYEELELELSILKSTKVESALLEKDRSFYDAFLSIPLAIALSRLSDGNFVDVNDNFLKLTGFTKNEVIGRNSAELGINIDNKSRNEILLKLSLGEQVPDFEMEIIKKTGEKLIGLSSLNKIDINGEQLICCSFTDITERKKLEHKNFTQSLLLEQIHNALITIDLNNYILSWNKHAETLYQWTRDEAVGKNIIELLAPEELKSVAKTNIDKLHLDGHWEGRFDVKRKDNTTIPVHIINTYLKDLNGANIGFIGISTDISEQIKFEKELKESEEKFKSIFEKSLTPIMVANDKGNYLAVNKATSDLFEYSIDELLHMNVGDLITTSNPNSAEQYEEYIIKGESIGEFSFVSKNGTPKIAQYHAVRTRPDYNLSIMMDITEQKRISEELTNAKLHAEVAMNSKQQFLSNMSHEIRTPMNSIVGFTKILLKTNLNDIQKEYLHAIKTSSEVLIVLINDILDLAKVDAGKMVFEKRNFKLDESMSTIIHLFEHKTQEKNLKLIKEYNNKIPLILKGDSSRLHQIMLNLISNAIKFTNEGSIKVSVDLLDEDDEKVTIEFSVKDTGIGIPENKIDTIFNNFEQGSVFTSCVYGGTGLGLAISKQLVELQGGNISVKSDLGKGSIFSFILNFEKTSDAFEIESDNVEFVTDIKNLYVLIVEDVKLNQLLLKTILNDYGFKYDVADNGLIAIDKLQSNTYDIILMDLMMPEMNGLEATEYIRNKMDSKIPIIALTADVTTVDVEKCKAYGMNDYISKPIDEKLLLNKIVSLVK